MAGYTSPSAFWVGGAGVVEPPPASVGYITTLPFFNAGTSGVPPVTPPRRKGGGHGAAIQEKYLVNNGQILTDNEMLAVLATIVIIEEH